MSKMLFTRPKESPRGKALALSLALLTVAGLAAIEVRSYNGHHYRNPASELANYLFGGRYHVNLSCAAEPHARTLTLRAGGFEDAHGYLTRRLPGCQLAEIRRFSQTWN